MFQLACLRHELHGAAQQVNHLIGHVSLGDAVERRGHPSLRQRDAIGRKELVEGMSPRAVEMAWSLPERRRIDRPAATEEWIWPGGKRKAFFQDERLQRWER